MKKTRLAALLAFALSVPALAWAAVPQTLAFSARISDNGQPVTGPKAFTFVLWRVATGGAVGTDDAWTETQSAVPVNDGVVATSLGDVANGGVALPVFDGTPLWLEVTMGSTVFSPRIAIRSVPYALRAGTVDLAPAMAASPVNSGISVATTETPMASVTVNIPAAGYVTVTGQASWYNPNNILYLGCFMREDGVSPPGWFWWWDPGSKTTVIAQGQSRTATKAVTAGSHTYQLSCSSSSLTATAYYTQVVVQYFPTSL